MPPCRAAARDMRDELVGRAVAADLVLEPGGEARPRPAASPRPRAPPSSRSPPAWRAACSRRPSPASRTVAWPDERQHVDRGGRRRGARPDQRRERPRRLAVGADRERRDSLRDLGRGEPGRATRPPVEWLWMSMKPGARTSPSARTTRSPFFGASFPTAVIVSPVTRTSASRSGPPVPSAIRAPRIRSDSAANASGVESTEQGREPQAGPDHHFLREKRNRVSRRRGSPRYGIQHSGCAQFRHAVQSRGIENLSGR